MGDFGPRFLEALAGGVPGQAPSPVGVVPPEHGMAAEMNPGMKMFGITPDMLMGPTATTPGEVGGMPAPPTENVAGGMGPEAEAIVRGFKPKKISFWGALGDQLLKYWGNEPAFEQRINNINMQRAMEGFTQDPIQAIRRIGQIPGMQGKAWDMLNTHLDNERAKQSQDSLIGTREDKILKGAASLAGVALRNPAGRSSAIARYNQILRRNNMEDYLLPDDVDDATLESIFYGGMPPNQMESNELRRIRLEQQRRDTESKINRRKVQNANDTARVGQGQQRINIAKSRPQGGGRGGAAAKPDYAGRTLRIKDSRGNERIVEFSKDGKTAYSETGDGRIIQYNVNNGKLTRVSIK